MLLLTGKQYNSIPNNQTVKTWEACLQKHPLLFSLIFICLQLYLLKKDFSPADIPASFLQLDSSDCRRCDTLQDCERHTQSSFVIWISGCYLCLSAQDPLRHTEFHWLLKCWNVLFPIVPKTFLPLWMPRSDIQSVVWMQRREGM